MPQSNPFDQFDGTAQAVPVEQVRPLQPILTDPNKAREAELREADAMRDETRLGLSIDERERGLSKDKFDRVTTYRKEFLTEPLVREFRGVEAATRQIIDLAKRDTEQPGPGDIALIISFMKALDPTSVVREGEFATAENAGGVPERVRNAYNKYLEGGRLSPELKREFASTAASFYNSRLQGYNDFARDYRGLVEAEGEDPDRQGIRLAEEIAFGGDDLGGNAALQAAFDRGASKAELLALAQQLNVTFPGGEAKLDELIAYRDGGGKGASFVPAPDAPDPRVMAEADRMEAQLGETGLMELAAQGMTLGLSDEAGGAGRAIGQALTGDFNVGENYNFGVEVERELLRRARERTGGFGTAAELAGGGGAVRAFGNMAMNAGRAVAGSGAPVTRQAIQGQMVRQGAAEGAMVGGATGFGYGEGAEDTLIDTATGAIGGAALGAIMQRIANKRANRGGGGGSGTTPAPTTPGGAVIQSADEFNRMTGANVQPLPADTGGAITRRASGAVAQTTFGAKPIVEAAQRANDEARAGISTLASRQGSVPASKQAAGEIAAKGADKVIKNTKTKVDVLYANARRAAQGVELELPMAQTVLQSHIDELSRVPGGGEGLSTLQTLANDIAGKKFPVDGIKAMRTQLRDKFIKDGLRGSDLERRVNDVVDAAELDIEDGLIALNNTNAAKAYAEASKAAAERFTLIDDVLEPILGRSGDRSGEEVFSAIERLARGDAVTLGKFMKALPADEAGSIRGAIVDRLGRVSAGRQDATGQAFSMNDFLTRWNDEGFSREAKAALFDGETRAALDALARVAQGTKEGQRFANFSNTGGANAFNFILNGAPFGAAVGGVLPAAVAGGTSVTAQFVLGNLLANPKFARWLAKMPSQQTAAATKAHIKRLSNIAAADATIAADALGLQQQLNAAFGPSRVAADQGTQGAGSDTKEPGKQ